MDEVAPTIAWPPEGEDAVLLATLAGIIERGGAARFLDVRVVAADARDFPERWKPTGAAVERLLARLLWHAHVDLDVAIDDVRTDAGDTGDMLRRSTIEWLGNADGAAQFHLEHIGNDDVAGLLVHEIGRAYLAWIAAGDPYRGEAHDPTIVEGSVAAIYLGLGVLAVNSATHRRQAGEILGNYARWETDVVVRGGLSTRAAVYLLAVQAVARDHEAAAFESIDARPRALLREMIDELRPHRAALLERLGVDPQAPRPVLERDPAPVMVTDADRPEPRLAMSNLGRPVFRVPHRQRAGYGIAGVFAGGVLLAVIGPAATTLSPLVLVAALAAAGGAGALVGNTRRYDLCATCERIIPPAVTTCPGCGGTIRGSIKHRDLRLDREQELEDRELG